MSRLEVFRLTPSGRAVGYADASNSWGGAYTIWETLCDRHHVYPSREAFFLNMGSGDGLGALWQSAADPAFGYQDWERTLLHFTADAAYVRRENLPRLIAALDQWRSTYGTNSTLDQLRVILLQLSTRRLPPTIGACFNMTSVADNWYGPPEKSNVFRRPGAFELFQEPLTHA